MSTTDRFLVIDFGTSAIKAGVVDGRGRTLGVGTVDYTPATPQPDWIECDEDTYWRSVQRAVGAAWRDAVRDHGDAPLAALTITGQGETFFCLDESLRPLRPAIVWLDNRAVAEAEILSQRFGPEEIYARTGQPDSFATWPAAKILWLRRHQPDVIARTRWFALLEDWLIARLSGQLVGESALWSSSMMLNIDDGTWWTEMLEVIDVTPHQLPRIAAPGDIVGAVGYAAAQELGITAGIPIVAGSVDLLVAAVGAGSIEPGTISEITGTVLGVMTCTTERPHELAAGLPVYRHVVPGLWCLAPYSQTAGLVLRWLRDNFYGPPGERSPDVSFDAVVAEAASVPPGADGVTFLPHLAGAWFPEYDLSAKAAIVGLTLATRRGHVVRAALESVGYMLRSHIENLASIGVAPARVVSLGPSARSELWRQIKADIAQLPVERVDATESTIVGSAVLAAVSIGTHPDFQTAVGAMVRTGERTEPDSRTASLYDRRYTDYRALYRVLEPTFRHDGSDAR